MRVMVYLASLVMASLSLAGYLWHKQSLQREDALVSQARTAVSEIHRVVKYRAATEDATLNQMGWPSTIDRSVAANTPTDPFGASAVGVTGLRRGPRTGPRRRWIRRVLRVCRPGTPGHIGPGTGSGSA